MDFVEHTRFVSVLDSILRIPPLFIMDTILNTTSISQIENTCDNKLGGFQLDCLDESSWFSYMLKNFFLKLTHLFSWALLYTVGLSLSLSIFMMSTESLLSIYISLSSIGLVIWSCICNEEFISRVLEQDTLLFLELTSLDTTIIRWFIGNFVAQSLFCMLFFFTIPQLLRSKISNLISYVFFVPIFSTLTPGINRDVAKWISRASSTIIFLYLVTVLIHRLKVVFFSSFRDIKWSRGVLRNYGVYTLFETQWARLQIPKVLKIFWLTRFFEDILFAIADTSYAYHYGPIDRVFPFTLSFFENLLKQSLVKGCETFIALLGMSSVIGSIFAFIAAMTRSFLRIDDSEENLGTVSAVLFLILALQTGLTSLEPDRRFHRLYRNFGLMMSACLHFLHNIVNSALMSLGASRSRNIGKHVKALLFCFTLVTLSSFFLYYHWENYPLSTWLVAITLFQAELIMKVIISLSLYLLLMIDSYKLYKPEKLDDYVYYLKATGNTIDFIFGFLIFLNGCVILIWEACGIIRAVTVCIHAYFNIWLQAKFGWNTFLKRRSASKKLEGTREATQEELTNLDDICSICFQELDTARVTRCYHYFHEFCLRKWLYVQDVCPLCHRSLCEQEKESDPSPSCSNLNSAT